MQAKGYTSPLGRRSGAAAVSVGIAETACRSSRGRCAAPSRLPSLLLVLVLPVLLFAAGCAKYPASTAPLTGTASGKAVSRAALSTVGTRYTPGGGSPQEGFDCSGLVCWAYAQNGVPLPRTTTEQLKIGRELRKTELRPGDIVVFRVADRRGLHTGIYTGNGKFVHSPSSGKRVREEDVNSEYWRDRFIAGRRPKQIQ